MSFHRPHKRITFSTRGPSRTKQSFKDECDINRILKKYEKTGLLTHTSKYAGRYEDLPSDVDYQASLNAIMQAEEAFFSLPSKLRARFDNDPEGFLAFVQNPANENELVELGLANARPSADLQDVNSSPPRRAGANATAPKAPVSGAEPPPAEQS